MNATADGLDQLLSLEEKIGQTIDLLKSARSDKAALLKEKQLLENECESRKQTIEKLGGRVQSLEKERDVVRGRLQKLLEQVDTLTRERSES